jgi:hypothetical protein
MVDETADREGWNFQQRAKTRQELEARKRSLGVAIDLMRRALSDEPKASLRLSGVLRPLPRPPKF